MKKFLTVFPIIMVLIMSNMVGIYANATDNSDGDSFIGLSWDNETVTTADTGRGLEDYKSYYSVTDDQYYIWFENTYLYTTQSSTGYDIYSLVANFVYFDSSEIDSSEYDSSTGCYTLVLNTSKKVYYSTFGMKTLIGSNIYEATSTPRATISNKNTYTSSINEIKYYPNESKVELYYDGTLKNTCKSVKNYQSNCDNVPSLGLDLSVSFTPILSGEVDRTIEQNGVQAESDYFSMNITNNSSKNAQFLMAIVPSGAATTFCGNSLTAVGVDFSDNAIYYLMYKEWVYSPKITGTVGSTGKAIEQEYYQASAWHIVNGNSTYTRQFNWQQINIQAGTSYDVVVVAVPTDFTKPSNVFSNSDCAHYLDSSTGAEVYRSTFTVPNPATYDSTNTDFGNIIGVPAGSLTEADGYIDENGEAVIEDVSASDLLEDRGTWEPGIIENSVELFSLEGVQSLFDSCGNVINFIGYSFVFMPSWYWIILLFGITSVVAIGIIKALKG